MLQVRFERNCYFAKKKRWFVHIWTWWNNHDLMLIHRIGHLDMHNSELCTHFLDTCCFSKPTSLFADSFYAFIGQNSGKSDKFYSLKVIGVLAYGKTQYKKSTHTLWFLSFIMTVKSAWHTLSVNKGMKIEYEENNILKSEQVIRLPKMKYD